MLQFGILTILLLFTACTTVDRKKDIATDRRPNQSNREAEGPTLDTHVHFSFSFESLNEDGSGFKKDFRLEPNLNLLQEPLAAHINLILSDSWLIDPDKREVISDYDGDHIKVYQNRHYRNLLNQKTSELVLMAPKRLRGMCGINLRWPDFIEVAKHCYSLPGMVGVKLHLDEYKESLVSDFPGADHSQDYYKKLYDLAQLSRKYKSVFLIHFYDYDEYVSVMAPLLEIAKAAPEVTFIIAHITYGDPRPFNFLAEEYKKDPSLPRNIYAETSAFLYHYELQPDTPNNTRPNKETLEAWRNFGMDYILFGSDGSAEFFEVERSFRGVSLSPTLTDEEKDKILYKNGMRLVKKLGWN